MDYADYTPHNISLALIADTDVNWFNSFTSYYAYWDKVGFDLACDGNGFLDGDFNRDCQVDMNDFCLLADIWMGDVGLDSIFNLSSAGDANEKGIINFRDFAIWRRAGSRTT